MTNKLLQTGNYFRPNEGGVMRDDLPAGTYEIRRDDDGYFLATVSPISDEIIALPGCASEILMGGVERFWREQARERYARFGLLYKRGVLMFGPPGSGKSIVIRRLSDKLVGRGGIVIQGSEPSVTKYVLRFVREREVRPIALIYEDIDIWVKSHGDLALTSIFDGESQIENVIYIATTNHIEQLSARLVNRPSRFDELIEVGMPGAAGREAYLRHAFRRDEIVAPDDMVARWVSDTVGYSVAHLRELVVSVMCLGNPYEATLERLGRMLEGEHAEDIAKRPAVRSVRRAAVEALNGTAAEIDAQAGCDAGDPSIARELSAQSFASISSGG